MEQIKIVDARTLPEEVRRQKQIEQLERMIVMRSERAPVYGAISADFRLPAVRGSATAAETSFIPHDRIHYRHAPRPDCPAIPPRQLLIFEHNLNFN